MHSVPITIPEAPHNFTSLIPKTIWTAFLLPTFPTSKLINIITNSFYQIFFLLIFTSYEGTTTGNYELCSEGRLLDTMNYAVKDNY